MRILHITPYSHEFYGGPSTAIRLMTGVAINAGMSVDVVTTNSAGPNFLNIKDGEILNEAGAFYYYFKCNLISSYFFSFSMKEWLNINIKKYDLVHLHIPFTAPFFMGAKISKKHEIPYIVSMHGLIDPWCLKQKSWKKIPYLYFLEKTNFKHARFLHVTSIMEADFVKSQNLDSEVVLLPLAVDVHNALATKPKLFAFNKVRLLFLGRLHPVKALPSIFKAIRILTSAGVDVELDVAGDGDAQYELFLKKIAIIEGVDNLINWHGHVDEVVRSKLFEKADIFVMPSFHENFGLAAAEAMASGLPVILSDQVGLAVNVVEFNAGLIVKCDDPVAIASSVQVLMGPKKWLASSIGAQELVKQRYGTIEFSKGLISLYERARLK